MKTFEMTDDKTEFEKYQAIFKNDGLLNEYRKRAEQSMKNIVNSNFEFYKPQIFDAYFPFSTRSTAVQANLNIAMFAVAQNEHNYFFVNNKMKTSEFIMTAFKLNPRIARMLTTDKIMENNLVPLIAKFKPEILKDIGVNYYQFIALLAVENNPSIYKTLEFEMQKDMQIIYHATNKPSKSNIRDIYYKQNKEYIVNVLDLKIPEKPIKDKALLDALILPRPLPHSDIK